MRPSERWLRNWRTATTLGRRGSAKVNFFPGMAYLLTAAATFNDFGSDLFLGEAFCSVDTKSCPAAGVLTAWSRKICRAVTSLPYIFELALPSERTVDPSKDTPAKSPRERE